MMKFNLHSDENSQQTKNRRELSQIDKEHLQKTYS